MNESVYASNPEYAGPPERKSMMDCALQYAAAGWAVIPCHTMRGGRCSCGQADCGSAAKHPIGQLAPNGAKNATTDAETIRRWWTAWPDANIAFALPYGMVVMDVDVKHDRGKYGDDTLSDLEARHGRLPDTPVSHTGGGGVQYFFSTDASLPGTTNVFPAIDSRALGNYVVLPPSLHQSGRRYEWDAELGPDLPLARVPHWFRDALLAPKGMRLHTVVRPADAQVIPEGGRNETLFKLSASLRAKGLSQEAILAALLKTNREQCDPPLADGEVERIVLSAARYAPGPLPAPDARESAPKPDQPPQVVYYDAVAYEEPKFLIKPYVPLGKITIIQADSGVGKTALSCKLAACVSKGMPLQTAECEQGKALLLTMEDDASTIRGRIEASGGDLSQCLFLPDAHSLTFNSPAIEQAVREHGVKLLVFDPLQSFLGQGVDMHRANETRPVLDALAAMAARCDCAVVIVSHMSKGTAGGKAIYRALGSVDIPAAARSVLYVERNPHDKEQCVIVHTKSSNAKMGVSILYRIGERGGVRWEGYSDLTYEDMQGLGGRKENAGESDFEDDPVVQVVQMFHQDNPKGAFVSWDQLNAYANRILGYYPCNSGTEWNSKLTALSREFKEKNGIRFEFARRALQDHMEMGQRVEGSTRQARGVKIMPYAPRTAFQLDSLT